MVDITPSVPRNRQRIESYGSSGFIVTGVAWSGSILVRPRQTLPWEVKFLREASLENLAPLLTGDVDVLLLGCGSQAGFAPPEFRAALRRHGVILETMDTGAACRTYNVLLAEERRIAAALIALK